MKISQTLIQVLNNLLVGGGCAGSRGWFPAMREHLELSVHWGEKGPAPYHVLTVPRPSSYVLGCPWRHRFPRRWPGACLLGPCALGKGPARASLGPGQGEGTEPSSQKGQW